MIGGATPPAPAAHPLAPRPFVVKANARESHDVFTLTLDGAAAGPGGFAFAPGQFNMLWAFGVGEAALSVSGDPARPDLVAHTIRAVGSVTEALADLRRGDTVGLRGPFGRPWPLAEAEGRDLVLLAGGIGLAPLRPVIYHVLRNRQAYGRVALLCGARSPEDLVFARELEHWERRKGIQVLVTVDRAPAGPRPWSGEVGVVTGLVAQAAVDTLSAVALISGPELMVRFAARELNHRGVTSDRVFVSLERDMKCAIGQCGHCQLGPAFVCQDGPIFRHDRIAPLLDRREL